MKKKQESFITLPRWHRLLIQSMSIGMVCFFVFALVIYWLYDPVQSFDRGAYIGQFIVLPTVVQMVIVAIYASVVQFLEPFLSERVMTIILSICVTTYLGVMVCVHNSVPEMAILLVYPIFGATIYNSRLVMFIQSIVSTATYAVIKTCIIPRMHSYMPENTASTYLIIFFGLAMGAVIISFLLRQVSLEMLNISIKERTALRKATKCDQMTGLYNHSTFYEMLDAQIEKSRTSGESFSLIVMDIDNFKQINDTYGHVAGDKIIQKAVRIMQLLKRPEDVAFRYGGEEFAILMPHADEAAAFLLADKILDRFYHEENLPQFEGKHFSMSAGAVTWQERYANAETLFEAADEALYHAKNHGKNHCVRSSAIT